MDISKCSGRLTEGSETIVCGKRENCHRYTAPASEWQSWMMVPASDMRGDCEYYLPVHDGRDTKV